MCALFDFYRYKNYSPTFMHLLDLQSVYFFHIVSPEYIYKDKMHLQHNLTIYLFLSSK